MCLLQNLDCGLFAGSLCRFQEHNHAGLLRTSGGGDGADRRWEIGVEVTLELSHICCVSLTNGAVALAAQEDQASVFLQSNNVARRLCLARASGMSLAASQKPSRRLDHVAS